MTPPDRAPPQLGRVLRIAREASADRRTYLVALVFFALAPLLSVWFRRAAGKGAAAAEVSPFRYTLQ